MSASAYPDRNHRSGGNGNAALHGTAPGAAPSLSTPATGADANSVGQLLRQLTHDVPELVVKELALARAELTDSMQATKAGIAAMVGGGAVLLSGLVVLLMSAVYGLSNVMAPWLAALLVGAAVVVIGLVMVSAGKKKLEPTALRPDRTLHQLHKDGSALNPRSNGRSA